MANDQRSKARALIDPDVLTLGATSQRTRTSPGPATQANMSRQGAASPQPGLTPKARPFAKGGHVPKGKKMAQAAGLMAALAGAGQGAPIGAAPPAMPPMGAPPVGAPGPMGAPPGMKRGGRYAKGGHSDEAEDRVLFKKMFKQEESKEAKMKRGGRYKDGGGSGKIDDEDMTDAEQQELVRQMPADLRTKSVPKDAQGNEMRGMRRGGHARRKPKEGSAEEERGESPAFEATEDESSEMKRGGICKKCGGRMSAGHKCGGRMAHGGVPRHMAGRKGFALGGPGKMRKGEMTPAGLPTKPKREPGNLI